MSQVADSLSFYTLAPPQHTAAGYGSMGRNISGNTHLHLSGAPVATATETSKAVKYANAQSERPERLLALAVRPASVRPNANIHAAALQSAVIDMKVLYTRPVEAPG